MRLIFAAGAAALLLGAALPAGAKAPSSRSAPSPTTAAPTVAVPAGLPASLGILPFRMNYHVLRNGWHLGNAVFELQRDDGIWHFHSRAKASGLASLFVHSTFSESSRFRVHDGILRPLSYTYKDSGNAGHDEHLSFDWPRGVATDTKGDKTHAFRIVPGMLDRLTAQLELSRELESGVPLAKTFVVINGGKVKRFRLKRHGKDEIGTPAGSFHTERVARHDPKSGRVTTFWLAPKYDWLPVKIEQREPGKATITFVLSKFRWLK